MTGTGARRSWWGWGTEDQALTDDQATRLGASLSSRFGLGELSLAPVPDLGDLELAPPRVTPPTSLADRCSDDRRDRAGHTYGKSFRDVARAVAGRLEHPPDLVAHPRTEADVVAVLDWCSDAGIACIPYGGGSSVVGGVEGRVGDGYAGVISLDLTGLDRVLEIDRTSRAARIQGGVLGPALEDQLRPHGLTLRHFPQSFEFSTLGGWLATRSGGHYATVLTHIDDMVESMRVVTPTGVSESRRLPGSGAGPSPDRWFLGSEGALGVVTEAWMRLQDRPDHKVSAAVRFDRYDDGVAAVRALSQSGLAPANCRLLDATEAGLSAGATDGRHVLVLGFESADHPVDADLARALELCADHAGLRPDPEPARTAAAADDGAVGAWRSSFLRAPYTRDALVRLGVVVETFETACTWDRFESLHAGVIEAVTAAAADRGGLAVVSCRFTHVYPDGPAPYFSVYAPGLGGDLVEAWDEIKAAASADLLAHGGTITHHHAVGRDHRRWYDQQRPPVFGRALAATKASLDPAGVLNPGVLVAPVR